MFLSAKKGDKVFGQYQTGVVQSVKRGPRGGRFASVLWDRGVLNPLVNLRGNVWPSERARHRELCPPGDWDD